MPEHSSAIESPTWIVPESVADLSRMLQHANETRAIVRVARRSNSASASPSSSGARSTETPGTTGRATTLISLERLRTPIEHHAGDLIATIPAGATLRETNEYLGRERQWLPLDPPDRDATIGAIVSGNSSGPRRHRYGTPRDLIIGIELVLADGRIAKAGGRVVKNVAGYDLARMMCGARGSLAVVTSAIFKLSPLPSASRTVIVEAADVHAIDVVVGALILAPLTPSTLEVLGPPWRLVVRFESTESAAARQAEAAAEICRRQVPVATIVSETDEATMWEAATAAIWKAGGTLAKAAVLPTDVLPFLKLIIELTDSRRVRWRVGGRIALGVLDIRLLDNAAEHAAIVVEARRWAESRAGSLVVVESSSDRQSLDRWGALGDAWPLMQAMKARFDPKGILNPGGGPGGL